MSSHSLNLIDLVKGYLGGDLINKMSSLLGENTDKTKAGVNAAIPGLLSEFDNVASTPDGAKRLSFAVDDIDDSMLNNIGNVFSRGGTSAIDRGANILGSLLGGGALSRLSSSIGTSSGLTAKAATMLLSFVGPVILGVLKREKVTSGLDSVGLSNLLASQRSNISAARAETERVPRDTFRRAESYPAGTRAAPIRRRSLGWVLPLAILLGLGLIWYLASRPTSRTVHAEREANSAATLKEGLGDAQKTAAGILTGITDPASADAASPNIRALNSRLDQLHDTYESLPRGSKNNISSLTSSITEQLRPEVDRVMNIPGVEGRIGSQLTEMLSKFRSFS